MTRKKCTPEEIGRRAKIRELLQVSNVSMTTEGRLRDGVSGRDPRSCSQQRPNREESCLPVSYTHLTLPTT